MRAIQIHSLTHSLTHRLVCYGRPFQCSATINGRPGSVLCGPPCSVAVCVCVLCVSTVRCAHFPLESPRAQRPTQSMSQSIATCEHRTPVIPLTTHERRRNRRDGPNRYSFSFHVGPFRLGSRVVSVLDSGAEGPGFKSQPRRCRVTVLGKLFTPIVPLFTKL